MPLYEYVCDNGHKLSVMRSIHDDEPAETKCAECGGGMRQVIGGVGVTFKGSGFYSTDKR